MASESGKKFSSKSIVTIAAFGLVALFAAGVGGYFFLQYQNEQVSMKDPQKATEQESKRIVDEVGKMIVLPQNENPQIATVSDVTKLKEQSFFSQAKNGDIVLIYTQAQKAVLYDPAQKKIVEVGPINITEASPTVNPDTPTKVSVALLNGTSISGLSSTTEKELAATLPTATVVSKGNAAKNTYTKTIVVDISGKQAAGAAQVAKAVKGEIGPLPEGETKPANAEILVILGR